MPATLLKSIDRGDAVARVFESQVGDLTWFSAVVQAGDAEVPVRGADGLVWFGSPEAAEQAAVEEADNLAREARNARDWSALVSWFSAHHPSAQ